MTDHRERRLGSEMPEAAAYDDPQNFMSVVQQLLTFSPPRKHRPDIQYLFSMPVAWSQTLGQPSIDTAAVASLSAARQQSASYLLRQIMFVFPYLRSTRLAFYSSAGVLAGTLSASARTRGIWRSVAAQSLVTQAELWPPIDQVDKVALREDPGIAVLSRQGSRIVLDDERISVPAVARTDYESGALNERLDSLRSAEVVRFIGFLSRRLRDLGERIIFDVDYRDPRPRLVIETFLKQLYVLGALRGTSEQQAFTLRQSFPEEGVIAMDIEIAPAFPIDRISLTFVNRNGAWQTEVSRG